MHLGIANSKVPPGWTPEKDKTYPLRTWVQDIRLWSVATDTDANRQGPVAAQRIGGTAKELIRELDMNVLVHGMAFADANGNPVPHTGLECLIRALSRRYAPLAQEVEVHCIAEILQFKRSPGEDSDAVISRFELCRERALNGAGFDMSWVGFSFLLLCILGIPKNQWALLLAPTQGSLPRDQAQYMAFSQYVRRQGHLTDKGVDGVKNMSFFMTESEETPHEHAYEQTPVYTAWNSSQSLMPNHFDTVSAYTANASDNDAISSCNSGESEADISDLFSMPYASAGEKLYLAYRHHKRRWRKFTGGFKRRGKGKGKRGKTGKFGSGKFGSGGFKGGGKTFGGSFGGKGKGKKGRTFFVDDYGVAVADDSEDWASSYYEQGDDWGELYRDEYEDTVIYLGKGKFTRKNPKGKDGKTLTCSGCGSEEHFIAKCPKNTAGITHAQAQTGSTGSRTFAAVQNSSQASQGSSSSSGWGSMIYVGSAREIEHNSTSSIEFSNGQVMQLDAFDELDVIPEEVDNSPTLPLNSTQNLRHYHIPTSDTGRRPQLSRADSTQSDTYARQFAFVWFMPAAFHAQVRLKDGVEALLVDVGAWDNLVGDVWVGRASAQAQTAGQGCVWQKLKKMLSVEGVGQKANEASDEMILPICLEDASTGTFQSAVIPESELPALLGLKSLSKFKSLIDTHNKQLIFVGPGGYSLKLSPGSKVFKLHSAPTGHLMLPCQCWKGAKITPGKPGVAL